MDDSSFLLICCYVNLGKKKAPPTSGTKPTITINNIPGSISQHHQNSEKKKKEKKTVEDLTLQGPSSADPVRYFSIYADPISSHSFVRYLNHVLNWRFEYD